MTNKPKDDFYPCNLQDGDLVVGVGVTDPSVYTANDVKSLNGGDGRGMVGRRKTEL